jgi:hypothetical protein
MPRCSGPNDLHHLVAVVVDDLDRDPAGLRAREGSADGRVHRRPRLLADVGAEGAAELVVRVVGAGEVGMADEEGVAVVVRVEEPTRDVRDGRPVGGLVDDGLVVKDDMRPRLSPR